jgi:hypothetical protein
MTVGELMKELEKFPPSTLIDPWIGAPPNEEHLRIMVVTRNPNKGTCRIGIIKESRVPTQAT